ncbi:MAG: hypothetical protein MMC33_005431 [Icmadophila ericetorum]|nr:hypothetical protein [Icmadophila ericetorum]
MPIPPVPIGPAPRKLEAIEKHESSLLFPSFTADTAFALGVHLRNRLHNLTPKPASISITFANSSQLLFHACTHPGTTPDNDIWIARKRATVLRFGKSTWYQHIKFQGDEQAFAEKFGMGPEKAGDYAIHGGGVPIRVEGVEGVVAVLVVSGLKQEEDHMVAMEAVEDCIQEIKVNVQ